MITLLRMTRPLNPALLTDLYELTMLQAYVAEGMLETSVFSLFVRRLPERRNYLLACGLDEVLEYLEALRFDQESLAYLDSLGMFSSAFLRYLETFRFTGDVWAVAEGTPVFAEEPILEIEAPIAEAQLVETFVMNQIHLQTLLASKAARVVDAAQGRMVVDFGFRRIHGLDAAVKGARAFYLGGVEATSNVAAASVYGLRTAGTMAHSYVQAHDGEAAAFRAFTDIYPDTVLLVDTYDTLEGVRKVADLAKAIGERFRVRAVRLDSGDLGTLSLETRRILDEAGLQAVGIFASGGLDEDQIAHLVAAGAPINAFGVGTEMGVSRDAPSLDIVYKLVEYSGRGRLKLSPGKHVLPGRKQIYRLIGDAGATHDVLSRRDEPSHGRALMERVMQAGTRCLPSTSLEVMRASTREGLSMLPGHVRNLEPATPPYPVHVSGALARDRDRLERQHGR